MKKWNGVLLLMIALYSCKQNENGERTKDPAKMEVLNQLKKSVQQHPDSASLRMLFINALDSLQMYPEAIAQTDSMIRRDSLNNGLWFAKGQLLESNHDTAQAINSYKKALLIYPSVEAQLNLANLFAETKNAAALQICQEVSRMGLGRETNANCDFIAGVYNARTGNNARAKAFFDRAINNNYTLMEAYMEKGFIFYGEKNYTEAQKTFETAITINNTYADAYYWKAKTFEATGNTEDALLNYERSLGLDKNLREAREAIKRLTK